MAVDEFARRLNPLVQKVRLAISRAVVGRVQAAAGLQRLQVEALAGELHDGVERLQDYGFGSHPLPGSEAVICSIGGARSHPVAVVVDDRRFRIEPLDAGEVAIFDDLGQAVRLKRDRIEVESPTMVLIKAPIVEVQDADGAMTMRLTGGAAQIATTADVNIDAPRVTLTGTEKVTIAAPTVEIAAATKVGFT